MGYITNKKNRSPEVYPDPRGGAGAQSFARNSAIGPTTVTDVISTFPGTSVPWTTIASGAPAGVNVPITPLSTGRVRISGVLSLKNITNDPQTAGNVSLGISVDGGATLLPFPANERNAVGAPGGGADSSAEAVPFLIETTAAQTPVGILANVNISVTANATSVIQLIAESSSLDIQELSAPTG
jgi:hypothetical protein